MIKKKIFILLVFLLYLSIVIYQIETKVNTITSSYEEIYFELKNNKILSYKYDKIVHYLFSEIANEMNFHKDVIVNKEYQYGKICVYIINKKYINNENISYKTKSTIESSNQNFIAIKPNIIFIDENFLSFLLMTAHNSIISRLNGNSDAIIDLDTLITSDENTDIFTSLANTTPELRSKSLGIFIEKKRNRVTANVIGSYLTYNNYILFKDDASWLDAEFNDKIANLIKTIFAIKDTIGTGGAAAFIDYYKSFFYMIISHELAHLKYDEYFNFLFEEEEVDKISFEEIKNHFINMPPSKTYNSLNAIISFSEMMRDIVLVNVYDDFRYLEAKDVLLTLEEKQKNDIINNDSSSFVHPDNISNAYWNENQLMTIEEFRLIKNRLTSSNSSLIHGHLLVRAVRLIGSIKSNKDINIPNSMYDLDIFHNYDNLILSIFNQPYSIHKTLDAAGLGLSRKNIMKDIYNYLELNNCISLDERKCWIYNNNNIHIELIGKENDILEAVFTRYYPLNFPSKNELKNSFVMIQFINNISNEILKNKLNFEKFNKNYSYFIDFINGGNKRPTIKIKTDNSIISFGPINETRTYRISIKIRD